MRKLGIIAVGLATLAVPVLAQQRVDEKRSASKDGVVEISNVSGSVRVAGWDRGEVAVTGTLGRGTERLDFSGSVGRTTVKVVMPRRGHNVDGSDIEVHVPAGSRVEVDAVSAEISVDGVAGPLRLESVSGGISVAGNPREVEAKSVSGDVEIVAVSAPVRARSVSGRLTLRGVTGRVEASSVSGRIVVKGGAVSDAELQTTSGDIQFEGEVPKDGRLRAKTMSGSIELALPTAVAADFDVSTFSGDIDNELGPSPRRSSEAGPGKEVSFSTGGGGARIHVRSFSGDVRLRKR